MSAIRPSKILVVDDVAKNVKLLEDLLTARGYDVVTAASGAEALERLQKDQPDLVLLDVVMPEMSGYELCRRIRANPATRLLPVAMVSALDPREERVRGIEAGADDFFEKPIHQAELVARVRSLLRIKELHDTVESQARELAGWNQTLQQRVDEQVSQLERMARLKRFLAPQLAEIIVADGTEQRLLESHRRNVTVVFVDIRGFTAFAEAEEPEEVMGLLGEYHVAMGRLILAHEGTLDHFSGDGIMVFFNDPIELPEPEQRAVQMTLAMREEFDRLRDQWLKRGCNLAFGAGIAAGYATLGAVGFEGRWDYTAIGRVTNLASRLCDEAPPGHILVSQRVLAATEPIAVAEPFGELQLKGFPRPMAAHSILRLRGASGPPDG